MLAEAALVLSGDRLCGRSGADGVRHCAVLGRKLGSERVVHPLALTPVADQARPFKDAEVAGYGVLGELEGIDDLADAELVAALEQVNDADPGGVGEGLEDSDHLAHGIICTFLHIIPDLRVLSTRTGREFGVKRGGVAPDYWSPRITARQPIARVSP